MKILTRDRLESVTVPPGWANSRLPVISIDNPNELNFKISFPSPHYNCRIDKPPYYQNTQVHTTSDTLIVNIPFANNFCHNVIDFLPELIWLDQKINDSVIIAPITKTTRNYIDTFDIEFKHLNFIENDIDINSKKIQIYDYDINYRSSKKILLLKTILAKNIDQSKKANRFIYCTRNSGGGASHQRPMNRENEMNIIDLSREYCGKNNLIFTIFNGLDSSKNIMSMLDQAKLFSEAKVVCGPHGGAFANIIHIPEKNKCKVCEFTSGKYTAVQKVDNFGKNYNRLLGFAPQTYLDYYLIPFAPGSDDKETSIDIHNYKTFLLE